MRTRFIASILATSQRCDVAMPWSKSAKPRSGPIPPAPAAALPRVAPRPVKPARRLVAAS